MPKKAVARVGRRHKAGTGHCSNKAAARIVVPGGHGSRIERQAQADGDDAHLPPKKRRRGVEVQRRDELDHGATSDVTVTVSDLGPRSLSLSVTRVKSLAVLSDFSDLRNLVTEHFSDLIPGH